MNNDNVWIVIVLLVLIVGLSNLLMFLAARGFQGGGDFRHWKQAFGSLRKPFKQEDDQLDELHRRVGSLPKDDSNKD